MTPNQLVAHNLRRARDLRGWTQEEAATRLSPYVRHPWTRATYSMAEGSKAGKRVRQFDADELAAFAEVFDVPVGWFFAAPEGKVAIAVEGAKPFHWDRLAASDDRTALRIGLEAQLTQMSDHAERLARVLAQMQAAARRD